MDTQETNLPQDSGNVITSNKVASNSTPSDKGFGIGAGALACGGVGVYALDFPFVVTGSSTAAANFAAAGISWDFGAFIAEIAGALLVDPHSIAGKCHFHLVVVDAVEVDMCTLTLSNKKGGTVYGIFTGLAQGADAADISGDGKIVMTK